MKPSTTQLLQFEKEENITDNLRRLTFTTGANIDYYAGQYLQFIAPGEDYLFFTIANEPDEQHIELLVEDDGYNRLTQYVELGGAIETNLPLGDCYLENLPKKFDQLILVAAASGFAQMQAMIDDLARTGNQKPVTFIWSADRHFMDEKLAKWQDYSWLNIHLINVRDQENKHQELIDFTLKISPQDLSNHGVVCCGSPKLAIPMRERMMKQGLIKEQMLSDAFQFS